MKMQLKRMVFIAISLMVFSSIGFAEIMYVTESFKLPLRTGPSTEYKTIAMVESGQQVEILESAKKWSRVRLANGQEGYLLTRYLVGFAETRYVTESFKVALRTGPSTEYKVIAMPSSGEKVEILEPGDDWSRVRLLSRGQGTVEGYVLSKYLITEERWRQIREAKRKKQEERAEEKKLKAEAERKIREEKRRKELAAREEKRRKELAAREEKRRKELAAFKAREKRKKAEEEQKKLLAQKRLDKFEKKYGVTDWPVMKDFSVNPFIYEEKKVAFVSKFKTMLSATEGVFQCSGDLFIVTDIPKGFFTKEAEVVIAGRPLGKKETKLPLVGEVLVPNLKFVGAYFCEKQHCRDIVWK